VAKSAAESAVRRPVQARDEVDRHASPWAASEGGGFAGRGRAARAAVARVAQVEAPVRRCRGARGAAPPAGRRARVDQYASSSVARTRETEARCAAPARSQAARPRALAARRALDRAERRLTQGGRSTLSTPPSITTVGR
jgi:hypothetical protein